MSQFKVIHKVVSLTHLPFLSGREEDVVGIYQELHVTQSPAYLRQKMYSVIVPSALLLVLIDSITTAINCQTFQGQTEARLTRNSMTWTGTSTENKTETPLLLFMVAEHSPVATFDIIHYVAMPPVLHFLQ